MAIDEILQTNRTPWLQGGGPANDIVLSSRVRLARNLANVAFAPKLDEAGAQQLVERLRRTAREWPKSLGSEVRVLDLAQLSPLDRMVLVEKHLISPLHAKMQQGAVLLTADESISVMVNEEDHLRIQSLQPGLQLQAALRQAEAVDDFFESQLDYAFHERWGYLTTCPTNTGTGLRASLMMHLPALVMTNQAQPLFAALGKVGVVVRGLYGEGSEALGHIFQVSNQKSLGLSEEELLENLEGVARQIIDRERSMREMLYKELGNQLEDRVYRAYGLLVYARRMTSQEAMELLSSLRLGIDLHILPRIDPAVFDQLVVTTRPAFLQRLAGNELTPEQRDVKRASLIRQTLERAAKEGSGGEIKK